MQKKEKQRFRKLEALLTYPGPPRGDWASPTAEITVNFKSFLPGYGPSSFLRASMHKDKRIYHSFLSTCL